jgi:hypothetical protein
MAYVYTHEYVYSCIPLNVCSASCMHTTIDMMMSPYVASAHMNTRSACIAKHPRSIRIYTCILVHTVICEQVIVVANRLPISAKRDENTGEWNFQMSSGGLVTALQVILYIYRHSILSHVP